MEYSCNMVGLQQHIRWFVSRLRIQQFVYGARALTFSFIEKEIGRCNRLFFFTDFLDFVRIPAPALGSLLAVAYSGKRFRHAA